MGKKRIKGKNENEKEQLGINGIKKKKSEWIEIETSQKHLRGISEASCDGKYATSEKILTWCDGSDKRQIAFQWCPWKISATLLVCYIHSTYIRTVSSLATSMYGTLISLLAGQGQKSGVYCACCSTQINLNWISKDVIRC